LGHFIIQAFETPPLNASTRAAIGMRTSISDAASGEFLTHERAGITHAARNKGLVKPRCSMRFKVEIQCQSETEENHYR
jgi:hypothetical protein